MSISVWGQRNIADVVITPVVRVPGSGSCMGPDKTQRFMEVVEGLFACDRCGVVPSTEDGMLQLKMVSTPDRAEPVFLGPQCTEVEVSRWLSREEIK